MTISVTQAHKRMSCRCLPELLNTTASDKRIFAEFVTQALAIRPVLNSSDRFTLLVSDGTYYSDCYLDVRLTPLILTNKIKPLDLVKVTDFFVHKNEIKKKNTLVILDLEPLSPVDDIVGQPSNVECLGMDLSNVFIPPLTTTTHSDKEKGSCSASSSSSSNKNSGSRGVTEGENLHIDIAAISPWKKNWILKARVTGKGEIKAYHSARAQGEMFKGILTDKHGAQIEYVCFKTHVIGTRNWTRDMSMNSPTCK